MGLGAALRGSLAALGQSLTNARKGAERATPLLAEGVDPEAESEAARKAAQAEAIAAKQITEAAATTLAGLTRRYHEEVIELQRATKHSAQWLARLELTVPQSILLAPIDNIEPAALLTVLAALHKHLPETCDRAPAARNDLRRSRVPQTVRRQPGARHQAQAGRAPARQVEGSKTPSRHGSRTLPPQRAPHVSKPGQAPAAAISSAALQGRIAA